MANSDYEEQLAAAGRRHVEELNNEMNSFDRSFSNMMDRQRDMILNFYKASTEAGRESVREDMQSRHELMKNQLDTMKRDYIRYSKFMSKADKQNYQRMYQLRDREFKDIEREIQSLSGVIEDEIDNISETFSERFNRITDELRDIGMSLNLSSIAQSMEDNIDSYIENLRQLKARATNFESDLFNEQVSSYARDTGILSRNAASEVASNFMTSMGIDSMKVANKYLKEIEALSVMGIDSTAVENIVWQDNNTNSNGRFLRSINNMAAILDNNNDLAVTSDNILSAINENVGNLFGIAEGDATRQKKLTKSVAMIAALQQTTANNGITDIAEEIQSWFSYGTNLDFMNDEQFRYMAAATGYDVRNGLGILNDNKALADMIIKYRDMMGKWSDATLYSMVEQGQTPFSNTASAKAFLGMSEEDLRKILGKINSSIDNGNNLGEGTSVMTDSAEKTVGAVQEIKNQFSGNGAVARIADTLEGMDLSLADIGGILTIGSTAFKAVGGLGKLLGKVPGLSGMGGAIGGLFSRGAASGGSALGRVGGLFGRGAASAGSAAGRVGGLFGRGAASAGRAGALGNVGNFFRAGFGGAGANTAAGQLGMNVLGFGAEGGMATLGTGGAMSAGLLATSATGIAGAAMTLKDAVGGYKKAEEWLGNDGKLVSGKVNSTLGGAIGGTGPGLGEGKALDVAKNTGANALKGAAIGATVGSVIPGLGTAIGAAVGGGIGAVTGLIGGDRIAKAAQTTWNFAKDCANEAFNTVGVGVEAVNGALQELGPVGQTLGNTLTESWGAVTETKDKIKEVWADPNKGLVSKIGGTVGAIFSGEGKIAKSIIKNMKDLGTKAWNGIKDIAGKAWDGIKTFASDAWDTISSTASSIWQGLQDGAKVFAEAGATLAEGLGTGAGNLLSGAGAGAGSIIDSITGGGISGILESAGKGIGSVFSGAGEFLFGKKAEVNISEVQKNMTGNPILDRMDLMLAYIKVIAENGVNNEAGGKGSKGLIGNMMDGARSVGKKAASGIKGAASWIGDKVGSILGFSKGLSYVPNDGLAMIHKGEAVLTKGQADVVRASADGGINTGNMFGRFLDRVEGSDMLQGISRALLNVADLLSIRIKNEESKDRDDMRNSKTFMKTFKSKGLLGSVSGTKSTSSSFLGRLFGRYGVTAFAKGGVVKKPMIGLVGENGPELITPLTDSKNNPNVGPINTSATDLQAKIWNFLKGKGLSNAGAAGVLGNIGVESAGSFNPNQVQGDVPLSSKSLNYASAVNSGKISEYDFVNRGPGGGGFGLVQWTYPARKQKLYDKAKASKKGISDLGVQLSYLWDELSRYTSLVSMLKTTNDVTGATQRFMNEFERPGVPHLESRISYAKKAMKSLASYKVGTPWLPNDQVALIHEGEMVVPADVNPMNNTTSTIPLGDSGNGDTIETLKWMVYRLEAKFDKLISVTASSGARSPRRIDTSDTDRAYSFG